jgi:hypothetical protein
MWIRRLSEIALASWLGLWASVVHAQPVPPPSDDGLAESRERFKQGMDLYEHGAPADAIAVWEPIYRELGEHRGYRLAYDLGLAYAALEDPAHAADRLQTFLNEVDARRAQGQSIGAAVTKEESDARARLASLAAFLGRMRVTPGRAVVLRVDASDPYPAGALVWVRPGEHAVTFDPRTPNEQTISIEVTAGALLELVPPPHPLPGEAQAPSPVAATHVGASQALPPGEAPAPAKEPLPPVLIAIGGGITLGATVAAVALEIHANALRDDDIAAQARSANGSISAGDRASFATVRDWAYVAIGTAAGFGAITAGLATWYLAERSHGETARPAVGVGLEGPRLVLDGSF